MTDTTPPSSPARDRFIEVLHSRRMLVPGEESVINVNLDAYAHELAERLRKHFVPRPPGSSADYVRGLDDGLDVAADLIDPEAQR